MNQQKQTAARLASGFEFAPHFAQQIPTRLLVALHVLAYGTVRPSIYLENNGRGQKHYVLRYWNPSPIGGQRRRQSMYLGRPGDEHLSLLKKQVEHHWGEKSQAQILCHYELRISRLRQRRKTAKAIAAQQARLCGFYFRGYAIHKQRSSIAREARDNRLARLEAAVGSIQSLNYQLAALTSIKLISLMLLAPPHNFPSKAEKRATASLRCLAKSIQKTAVALDRIRKQTGEER